MIRVLYANILCSTVSGHDYSFLRHVVCSIDAFDITFSTRAHTAFFLQTSPQANRQPCLQSDFPCLLCRILHQFSPKLLSKFVLNIIIVPIILFARKKSAMVRTRNCEGIQCSASPVENEQLM